MKWSSVVLKYCISIFILFFLTYNKSVAQLPRLNSIDQKPTSDKINQPVTTVPAFIDSVRLKKDSSKIDLAAGLSIDSSVYNQLTQKIGKLSTDLSVSRSRIESLDKIGKKSKEQQDELDSLKKEITNKENAIQSTTQQVLSLQQELKIKSSEAHVALEIKKQYRKEYYEGLLADYRANKAMLDTNYAHYKRELNAKIDSLRPGRWPLYDNNKDSMVREMATIYGTMWASTREISGNIDGIVKKLTTIDEKIKAYEEIGLILKYGNQSENYLDSIFSARKEILSQGFIQEQQTNTNFQKQYEAYRAHFQANLSKVQQISEKYKPKETKQSSDASVLANFIQPLNQSSSLIPAIDIFAYQKFGNEDVGMLGQVKLFLAAPGNDTNKLAYSTRLFIPEASQLGVMADFLFGFIPSGKKNSRNEKLLGIGFSFYYLQKQLLATDSTKSPFSTGVIQLRSGFELTLIRNALLVYGNLNGFYLGKGVEQFQKYYSKDNSFKWFGELGLRSYLNLQSNAKISILLDLRFIPVGNTVGNITGTLDKFIPLFKLGIVKDFDF